MTPTGEGPSSQLIARIHHLQSLLENLPFNPIQSPYHFGLGAEHIEEEGVWCAFNQNLEVCFETHKLQKGDSIVFHGRMKVVHGLDKDSVADDRIADANDDVVVPLSAVIRDALGFDAISIPVGVDTGAAHCVDSTEKLDDY